MDTPIQQATVVFSPIVKDLTVRISVANLSQRDKCSLFLELQTQLGIPAIVFENDNKLDYNSVVERAIQKNWVPT